MDIFKCKFRAVFERKKEERTMLQYKRCLRCKDIFHELKKEDKLGEAGCAKIMVEVARTVILNLVVQGIFLESSNC